MIESYHAAGLVVPVRLPSPRGGRCLGRGVGGDGRDRPREPGRRRLVALTGSLGSGAPGPTEPPSHGFAFQRGGPIYTQTRKELWGGGKRRGRKIEERAEC